VLNPESSKADSGARREAFILLTAVVALAAVPPSWVERLPSFCLNQRVFGFCPACGSLRALVRLFHGDVAGAVRFNANVLLTGTILVLLLLARFRRAVALRFW